MKIVADAHIPFVSDYFGAVGELILLPGREITAACVKDADILLVRTITPVNADLLQHSKVKFVGSVTAGADHLDTAWLDEAGIAWSVAAGFNAPPVADYVIATIAALQKKRLLATQNSRAAVVGVGNTGALVAKRLQQLGFDVLTCDPLRAEQEKEFAHVALEEIADVDLISLHVPLTKIGRYPTHHVINQSFLQRQKKGAILLNVSRGAVIDSRDLIPHGQHLHWCFDVWEHEPHINKALLEKAFIATPHIAGYSAQSKMRGIEMIYRIACARQIIALQLVSPLTPPSQELAFAETNHHWQDIVLGVFNPLVVTVMMHALLLPTAEHGSLFDEMRHQFNYRHEFSATTLLGIHVAAEDLSLLEHFGFKS